MEETYQVEYPENGRVWTLRPIPKMTLMDYGFVPDSLTQKAKQALIDQNDEAFGEELLKTTTEKDTEKLLKFNEFIKYAFKFAVVSPSIVLDPQGDDEISAFEVSDEERQWLIKQILDVRGGEAKRLNSFRGKSGLASRGRSAGKKLRKKSKRNSKNKG